MKQPTQAQLQNLKQLRNESQFVEYLRTVESDYLDKLIIERDDAIIRQLQGSIFVVRRLLQLIFS